MLQSTQKNKTNSTQ